MVTPFYAEGTSSKPGYDIIFFKMFLLEYYVKWRNVKKVDRMIRFILMLATVFAST